MGDIMSYRVKKDNEYDARIKCNVTDCVHNCIYDSTCRLNSIKVGIMNEKNKAASVEGTCCKSYDYAGDLNESEVTGRD